MPLHCEVCASVAVVHPEAEAKDLVHCEWQESEILRLRLRMTVMNSRVRIHFPNGGRCF